MSDQSSPIREPEISREALIKVLADHFGFRPYEQMAEDKSDLRGKVRDGYDVNEPTKSDLAEVADAILNLAPVGGRGEEEPGSFSVTGENGWRPEVRAFADLMEAQLRDNDHKPGWKNDTDLDLFERLGEESAELLSAIHRHAKRVSWGDSWVMEDTVPRIGQEAADVANFAMMIADVCGALPPPPQEQGGMK